MVLSNPVEAGQMIEGPQVIGGSCPSPSYDFYDKGTKVHRCCCRWFCCMNGCQTARVPVPPESCLANVPGGAEWRLNNETGNYQAFTLGGWNWKLMVLFLVSIKFYSPAPEPCYTEEDVQYKVENINMTNVDISEQDSAEECRANCRHFHRSTLCGRQLKQGWKYSVFNREN